jgi:hypothetical protein
MAVDFTLAGEHSLATLALEKSRAAEDAGAKALGAVAWDGEDGAALRKDLSERYAGQTWLLLMLRGGDRVVVDLAGRARPGDWGQVHAFAGLAIAPNTRLRAYALLARLPRREQVDVMHEIFHAHDHMRPWASNYALSDSAVAEGESEFARAYAVFRGLAWRLWEGQRPVEETIEALDREGRKRGLEEEWQVLFLDYYGRNILGLYQNRANGMDIVRPLKQAVESSSHPMLALLRRRLEDIEARGKLDVMTLSDAWRIR